MSQQSNPPENTPPVSLPNPSLISEGSDWTFELIEKFDTEIARIAETYQLDTYPNQIEIIRSDQMMDAYASVGMPIGYNHWLSLIHI